MTRSAPEPSSLVEAVSGEGPLLRVLVVSRPSGVLVIADDGSDNGQLLGPTPLEIKRKANTRLALRLEKKGYKPLRRQLTFESNETLDLALERRDKEVAAPVAAKEPAASHRGKRVIRNPSRKAHKSASVAVKPAEPEPSATDKSTKAEVVVPEKKQPDKKKTTDKLVDDLM